MSIGILGGTGPLGRGLAARLASAGEEVFIGSRDAERAASVAGTLASMWPGISAQVSGSSNEAAAKCDSVVVATPWDSAFQTVRPLAGDLAAKLVISVGTALVRQGREVQPVVPARGSVAASLQAALPESAVAAACHHLPAERLEDPEDTLGVDVLVCADAPGTRRAAMELLARVPGLRPLDAGSLAMAAPVEAFTAVLVSLNIRYKARTTVRIEGVESGAAGR
ncbi:MAG: NADPH-dependent F420 reductase [Actinobacteria bacterium]|nr:NADPH-dependent F420 reductase [Actinomycetota bacterium]MDA8184502.1 NADPH-dependent F420 reductase [Actinomycetota bacterium]